MMEGTKKKSLLMIECELERLKNNIEELNKEAEEAGKTSVSAEFYKQGVMLAKADEQIFLSQLLNQIVYENLLELLKGMEEENDETL